MPSQRFIVTALPFTPENWTPGGGFHISAHFAPRLYDGTQLGQFAGFTAGGVSWPETMSGLGYSVDLNGTTYDAELISEPDAGLWNHLFSNATPVIPHLYRDHKARRLRSFPVLDL